MINNRPFDLSKSSHLDKFCTLKYCLNIMSNTSRLSKNIDLLLGPKGEFMGGLECGIHRWNEHSKIEFGINNKFEGYRAYLGPEEHGEELNSDIEEYISEIDLKNHLAFVCDWHLPLYPNNSVEIKKIRQKYHF